ncbi:MAG: hypothetical protein CTY28_11620 [Hyphomicrobium sp.]|nr:MAG: hypothetical protein CTY28_11620 [Hyphomicrobium sp.]
MSRARESFAFSLFVLAAALGVAGQPIWTSALVGTALGAVAFARQYALRERFAAVGASEVLGTAHLASFASALLFCAAAWAVGAGLRLGLLLTQ